MKRPFFIILLAVAVSHTLVSLSRFRLWLRNKAMPTTILINGKIVSMDDRSNVPNTPGNIFQAMAIKGKKLWLWEPMQR